MFNDIREKHEHELRKYSEDNLKLINDKKSKILEFLLDEYTNLTGNFDGKHPFKSPPFKIIIDGQWHVIINNNKDIFYKIFYCPLDDIKASVYHFSEEIEESYNMDEI